MAPKEETVASGVALVQEALASKQLASGQAAKLRGIFGFTGSFAFGAVGMTALKRRQYWDEEESVSESLAHSLTLDTPLRHREGVTAPRDRSTRPA